MLRICQYPQPQAAMLSQETLAPPTLLQPFLPSRNLHPHTSMTTTVGLPLFPYWNNLTISICSVIYCQIHLLSETKIIGMTYRLEPLPS